MGGAGRACCVRHLLMPVAFRSCHIATPSVLSIAAQLLVRPQASPCVCAAEGCGATRSALLQTRVEIQVEGTSRAMQRHNKHMPAASCRRRRHSHRCRCLWVRRRQLAPPVRHCRRSVASAPHCRVNRSHGCKACRLQGALHRGAVHAAHKSRQQGGNCWVGQAARSLG